MLGAEVWPPPAPRGHSSTFVSFPPDAMPSHADGAFPRPMKSALFPGVSHARGLRASDISPCAALGGADHAGCPSAFVWSFVPSITAGTVRRGARGTESTARHRPTATGSDLSGGDAIGEPGEEQPQQPCLSCLLAEEPSPGIPAAVPHAQALPAVATCARQPGTPRMLQTPLYLTVLALHLRVGQRGCGRFSRLF